MGRAIAKRRSSPHVDRPLSPKTQDPPTQQLLHAASAKISMATDILLSLTEPRFT
jgi:hypothetical protein